MATNRNEDQCGFDAFSAMVATKKRHSGTALATNVASDSSTSSHKVSTDSRSTGYVVKKITGSTRLKQGVVEKKTGKQSVSIDTDAIDPQINAHHAASIDTDEFTMVAHQTTPGYPIIVDETDSMPVQEKRLRQTGPIKKEKQPQQRSLSVDISSDICTHAMPSVEKKELLGSGRVESVLGSGGMARVYKIWNEKLEMHRAVKVLLPTTQKEQADRFLTEAKITAKLHHPNIIETYDSGEWKGLPTIEMELVDGVTLNTFISANQLIPSPVSASIMVQIAHALAYAHSQELLIYGKTYKGVIHRDLKPSNIMVAHNGKVKLMDFGVARPLETGLHTVVTDSIVGTIHYFSPEQIAGYPIDHLTDVYSFGAVLYELLCGKNPFPYSNMVTMIQAKTKNQFRRLEDCSIEMDPRLASVAQTCLRTDKRERYPDFVALIPVLTEIVGSYEMGTPEEVMAAFCRNPGAVQLTYEQYLQHHRNSGNEQADVSHEKLSVPEVSAHVDPEPEAWQPKRTPKIAVMVIALLTVAIILAAVAVFYLSKNGNPRSFNTPTHPGNVEIVTQTVPVVNFFSCSATILRRAAVINKESGVV